MRRLLRMAQAPDRERLARAVEITRRDFLATSASGIGTLALGSLLAKEGLVASAQAGTGPMRERLSHHAPRAKACICIYMEGAPSQIDLFDPKPKLLDLDGQKLPESLTRNVRFAFIQRSRRW
jgi:hypothetical protein